MPEEDTFTCLCHACRVAHDAGGSKTSGVRCKSTATRKAASLRVTSGDGEFHKLRRIRLWASRPQQINHRIIRGFLAERST
jgi:hypothetical protein